MKKKNVQKKPNQMKQDELLAAHEKGGKHKHLYFNEIRRREKLKTN